MPSSRADRALAVVLRVIGAAELAAVPFVVAPAAWMDAVHDRLLGLGPLPDAPVVGYLARHLTALYAVHGVLLLAVSADVPRYRPLAALLGWCHLILGAVLFGIDSAAGLPRWWVCVEVCGAVVCGAVVVALARAGKSEPRQRRGAGGVQRNGDVQPEGEPS